MDNHSDIGLVWIGHFKIEITVELIASSEINVIVGLGETGLSVARYLNAKGKKFLAMDSRPNPPGLAEFTRLYPESKVLLGEFDLDFLQQATEVVLSPGVSRQNPTIKAAIANGIRVVGDIELFLRDVKKPVMGITGSNGKSTVTTLIAHVAESAGMKIKVGGNLGTPALDLIDSSAELYILELSSFQLENVTLPKLAVACILNISEDHMDRYDSLLSYYQAKHRIYRGAQAVVFNLDDKLTIPPVVENTKRFGFALQKPIEEQEEQFYFSKPERKLYSSSKPLLDADQLKLKGTHNIANVLAVYALGKSIGIAEQQIGTAVKQFEGLKHRCEWVAMKNGVTFINDSKGTNVGASTAAITGLKDDFNSITLIAGGDGKGADFTEFGETINRYVNILILMGRDAGKIAAVVADHVAKKNVNSMREAVNLAAQLTQPGGVVLLSPGCASFDMFSNYQERGNEFISATLEMCA